VRVVPLCDATGRVVKWYGQHTDIEERKQTEATLKGEKNLLEMVAAGDALPVVLDALCSLVNSIADNCVCSVLLVDDARGVVRHGAAPGVPRALTEGIDGRSTSEPHWGPCARAVSQNTQVIVADIAQDPGWRERDWSALCLQAGLRSCWTTPIRSRAGKPLGTFAIYQREPAGPTPLQLSLTARFTHVASIAVERAQNEAALNKMRAQLAHFARVSTLGALTASIAHEVSQPLSGVATNARLLERILGAQPIETEQARAAAQRSRRDAERAVAVVERLRSLFQKADGARERFVLGQCVHEVLDLLRHELQRTRVQLLVQLDPELPDVYGDRVQVQQVLVNLLLNAAEAISEQPEQRLLSVQAAVADGGGLKLTVSDTGPGIAPSVLPHLFEASFDCTRSAADAHRCSACASG
jgi:signal transduction histidine kinase